MPCRWDEGKGYGECSPLETTLAIKTTPGPAGRGVAVWYRAEMKNRTCQVIRLGSDFFLNNDDAAAAIRTGIGPRLIITDSDGHALPPTSALDSRPLGVSSVEAEIHPYHNDLSALLPIAGTTFSKNNPTLFSEEITLSPGSSAATSPSVLEPYRLEFRSVQTQKFVGTRQVPVPAENGAVKMRYAVPPPGFRRLTEYDLARPGKYLAHLQIDENLTVSYDEDDSGPAGGATRKILNRIAHPFAHDAVWGTNVHLKSDSVEISISR